MNLRNVSVFITTLVATTSFSANSNVYDDPKEQSVRFVQVEAKDRASRNSITKFGLNIEAVRSDSVWGFIHQKSLSRLQQAGHRVLSDLDPAILLRSQISAYDFPPEDSRFNNFNELTDKLKELVTANSDLAKMHSIGKTVEQRDIWALQINSSPEALSSEASNKPGILFIGNHHAREHLTAEVPLLLAQFLLENRNDQQIKSLIETRDIWIIPMLNPDGAEWDIEIGKYRWWRKNRSQNDDKSRGVDLNRNYGFMWGLDGADPEPYSEVYHGPAPFSEPETKAVKEFVEAKPNLNVLLSFHSYSELILYPWGYSENEVDNEKDRQAFKKIAKTMSGWNNYTPMQASALYTVSGETGDWAYGQHGIFAFTFELSPADGWGGGGFFPGQKAIDTTFAANLKPCLYLLDLADNPHRAIEETPTGFLPNYIEPKIPPQLLWQIHPY